MITIEKIKIYSRYKGDGDMWSRATSRKENAIMKDADWALLDSLLQDIKLVKEGYASKGFEQSLNKKIAESCENEATINKLMNTPLY